MESASSLCALTDIALSLKVTRVDLLLNAPQRPCSTCEAVRMQLYDES